MKQSLLSILILLLSSSFAPIHARNKPQPANSPSPVASPAPGPSNSDCSSIIYDMMDCLSYLTPGSNDTTPTKVCCRDRGILSVLQYNPKCICIGLESSKTMGFAVNNTRARAMPTTCKLSIVAPHCAILDEATPAASTAVSPSAGISMTSPSSVGSPTSSPSLAESPVMTAPSPSSSGTNHLSVSTLTLFSVIVSSVTYISFFN
ncbi:PREDICTED: non-specific lipid-transfer protein-like protein At2g13820 [Brassica oleracea var. oleracea]|uniref:non-specific lipid-transfer protein-like protein At2g13820 n=1 Tax=Brassica oleracea var. oleracea TaxID=109376 RepID=UPI0006A6E5B5|nr:PREDICTED: non-specific lipid-transfer protein-like protein At2g13820 [Brassica oleracea var. oleracea]